MSKLPHLLLRETTMAILSMLVQGIGVGTMALISHFTGEKDYKMSDKVLGQNACPEHYWVDVDADCFFFSGRTLVEAFLGPKAMCCFMQPSISKSISLSPSLFFFLQV